MTALCKSCLGAGCFYCLVDHFCVSLSRYNFLRLDYGLAHGAMRTFRQTCRSAGRFYSFINNESMSSRDDILLSDDSLADRSTGTVSQTVLGASSCLARDDLRGMSGSEDNGGVYAFLTALTSAVAGLVSMLEAEGLICVDILQRCTININL